MGVIAVKLTNVPWQTTPGGVAIRLTEAVWAEVTLMTTGFDDAGLPVAHDKSDVSLQETTSPSDGE